MYLGHEVTFLPLGLLYTSAWRMLHGASCSGGRRMLLPHAAQAGRRPAHAAAFFGGAYCSGWPAHAARRFAGATTLPHAKSFHPLFD
jgi:hypothetical protein